MDTANGLQLSPDIQLWLHQEDVGGLHDVEPLGSGLEGEKEHIEVGTGLEVSELGLEGGLVLHEVVRDAVLLQTLRDVFQHFRPLRRGKG